MILLCKRRIRLTVNATVCVHLPDSTQYQACSHPGPILQNLVHHDRIPKSAYADKRRTTRIRPLGVDSDLAPSCIDVRHPLVDILHVDVERRQIFSLSVCQETALSYSIRQPSYQFHERENRKFAYGFLLGCLVLVSTNGVIGNVKGMITSRSIGIFPTFHYESVFLSTNHVDLRN